MAARRPAAAVLLCLLAARVTTAQPSAPLTLAQAEQTALRANPDIVFSILEQGQQIIVR